MTVQSLRTAVSVRASELLGEKLVAAGIVHHKRQWRSCDCAWCRMKREATVVIGQGVPRFSGAVGFRSPGPYSGIYVEDLRDAWRDTCRQEYRDKLKALEGE